MNQPSSLPDVANVILCGISPFSSVFVQTIWKFKKKMKISGIWNPIGFPNSEMSEVEHIGGSFEDVLKDRDYDFIFLCQAPQVQYKLIQAFSTKNSTTDLPRTASKSSPFVILIPPISPCYNVGMLLDCGVPIGIAMPLRKILPISLLSNHLKNLREQKPLDNVRNASGLPSHWTFGVPRSFHARLSTASSIKAGAYSWLCEPGVMGGGLINLYGAGLIDLAFILTGGLKFTSVNCVSRVFDWKLTDNPNSIRRVSAEDYVLITGELESTEHGMHFESEGPVAVFCLSSELPPVDPVDQPDSNDDFHLRIELIGSSGRFVVSENGHKISWTPVQPRSQSKIVKVQKATTASSENEKLYPENCKVTNGLRNGSVNGSPANWASSVNGISRRQVFDDDCNPSAHSAASIHVTTVRNTETATLNTEAFNLDLGSKPDNFHPIRFAWYQWINQLAGSVQPDRSKLSLDALLATPEHWGYVQRVLIALEKSARLRCWVDVATCERT